jgi:hypothetical protein
MAWKASGKMDLPLTKADRGWDGDEARAAIFKWAGWPDDPDPVKARRAFFAYDDDDDKEKQSYKLPFATIVGGELKAVPHALHAVAVVLEGGRGGVDLPRNVIAGVRRKVETYYRKMGKGIPW